MHESESSLNRQTSEFTAELLNLSEHPITFEPISSLTNVFFDRDNQQIFCVRSNGVGGVIVKGPHMSTNISFRMEDKGSVASIKFSPSMNVLAIRRKDRSVIDFINFKNTQPIYPEFSQTFKVKSPNFQEFYWLDSNDILFVSEQGFEHYQVFADKRALKFMKFVNMPLNWLIWSREAQVFIVSTGNYGSILNPYLFSKGDFVKLPKFEVDLPLPVNMLKYRYSVDANSAGTSSNVPKYFLNESDVVVGQIYGEFYVMLIRQMTMGQQQQQFQSSDPRNQTSRKGSGVPPLNRVSSGTGSVAASASATTTSSNSGFSEIAMYKLFTDSPAKKTNVLKIQLAGRFTLNIIDELIVVHHRNSYSSLVFDIKMAGEFDGYTTCNYPVIKRASIQTIDFPSTTSDELTSSGRSSVASSSSPSMQQQQQQQQQQSPTEMYSMNWIMFLPNIIIDAKLGYFWFMELNLREPDLRPFAEFGTDYLRLVEFLLNRKNTKHHVIRVCVEAIRNKSNLKIIEKMFDKINELYKYSLLLFPNTTATSSLGAESTSHQTSNQSSGGTQSIQTSASVVAKTSSSEDTSSLSGSSGDKSSLAIIEQYDMHNLVFYPLMDDEQWWTANSKYTVALLVEYFRSLNLVFIPIEQYFYKLLVNALIKTNRIYQLHQYLQYHVLTDSKPLACLLLGLQETYSPSNQLALDMLKRLGTANEEIVDVLLSKGLILSALRFAIQMGLVDELNAAKFLETAKDLNDPLIYYEVFKFFEERNVRHRGNPNFRKDELCDVYVQHFINLFKTTATVVKK